MTKPSTKHTHRTKDRVTRTPLLTGDELRCSGRVGNSFFTSGTCRVNRVKPDGKSWIRKGPGSVHKPWLYTSTIRIQFLVPASYVERTATDTGGTQTVL